MPSADSNRLQKTAIEILSKRNALERPVLRHTAETTLPSTGEAIYLFVATEQDKPNDPPARIVLDTSGGVVGAERLSATAISALFAPTRAAVPIDSVAASRVKLDPPKNDLALRECDEFKETVTVTIPRDAAVSKADVYFLADTTGSMREILAAVQGGASNILAALSTLGLDIAYGVGNYKDFPSDPYAFLPQQAITTVTGDVQTAINNWSSSGGSDGAEGQLFALDALAEPPGGSIGWRAGSKRILVWFGDAPGHDPICTAISGASHEITEASITLRLVSEEITVLAISTTTGVAGALDGDPVTNSSDYAGFCGVPGGTSGQATRIASATGGQHVNGIDEKTIVQTIIALVKAAVAIKNVSLVPDAVIAPFVTSLTPAGGYGPLAGDTEHVLLFELTFAPGAVRCTTRDQVFTGSLDVVADGTVIGRKPTRVTIPACKFVYSVKFVCGVEQGCECACGALRPGIYATEINIHNYKCHAAEVETWLLPVMLAGAPAGRAPRTVQRRSGGHFELPAESATMFDCCRTTELLLGAPVTSPTPVSIGFLEIVSNVELSVTAVYTASDLKSNALSMQTEVVNPRLK